MEYTARETPQKNGAAERALTVVRERSMAMMEQAQFSTTTRNQLWAEETNTATFLSNMVPNGGNENGVCADDKF